MPNSSKKNFWSKLKKPFLCLAPMANVTDAAFRNLIADCGKPDVFWTEFVSVAGLLSKGRDKILTDLKFSKKERPIVAQIFGSNPDQMFEAAKLIKMLSFDGLDINMGCPDKAVEKQGAGAALMKNPELALELIKAAKRGVEGLPVSVKTRIGYQKNDYKDWIKKLISVEPAAITVHLRTKKEMSLVSAHWELAGEIGKLFKNSNTLYIANGDVTSRQQALDLAKKYKLDGVMIGRGIFCNPWLFNKKISSADISAKRKIKTLIKHIELYEKLLGKHKPFDLMKKHFKAYIHGFDGARELRNNLYQTKRSNEALKVLRSIMPNL
jgi:nifR3 family TIM-barrel protein